MQCPRCQKENVSGHAYCTHCRTELKTGVTLTLPEEQAGGVPIASSTTTTAPYVKRILRRIVSSILLFVVVALLRGLNWEAVMRGISSTKTGVERAVPKSGKTGQELAPRKADEHKSKPKKATGPGDTSGLLTKPEAQQEITADLSSATGHTVEPAKTSLGQPAGGLTIQSLTRAKVYIDGHFLGYTPCSVQLAIGVHRISLMADGYEEWRRTIQVNAEQQVELSASLTKILHK